jgi:hypothetical protein
MSEEIRVGVGPDYDRTMLKALEDRIGEKVDFIEVHGITGETAAWVVIATLTAQTFPEILKFVKFLIQERKVKSIEFEDFKVDNPTNDMVELFERKLQRRLKEKSRHARQ